MNTKDYSPVRDGFTVSVLGVGGAGKSRFARTAAEHVLASGKRVYGFLTPAEAPSYAGLDIEYTPLYDAEWHPSAGTFKASAYRDASKALRGLFARDDLGLVIVDTATRLSQIVFNDVMAAYGTDDPTSLGGNSRTPYQVHNTRMLEFVTMLDALRWAKHCFVIVNWHADVREVEGLGTPRKETEKVGGAMKTVTKWDEALVPAMLGSLRATIAQEFDLHLLAEPVYGSSPFRCRLQALPTSTRLVKSRLPILDAISARVKSAGELPNDFPTLLTLIGSDK